MKNIFQSKTFWLNALGIAQLATQVIPMDPEVTGLVLAGLNIVNRRFTSTSVTILPSGEKD